MDTLYIWMITGTKGTTNTPFKFYISEIDIGFCLYESSWLSNTNYVWK